MLINSRWNEKYSRDLTDNSPAGLRAMNRGTSYFVAPLSFQNETVQNINKKNVSFIQARNDQLIKTHDPKYYDRSHNTDQEEGSQGISSPK